jgi:hypothetical protein
VEAPGALGCRSGFPPIPAETGRKYSKRLPLTVLFQPQVQNYSLTKLGLILAGAMALAIQRFLGSSLGASGGAGDGRQRGRPPLATISPKVPMADLE